MSSIKWVESLQKLSTVQRYSQAKLARSENVLEHSGMVALITLHLSKGLLDEGHLIDVGLALTKAMLHDIEESDIGDISQPAKYHSKEITNAVKLLETQVAMKIFMDSNAPGLFNIWIMAKDGDEGLLVAFADNLSVLIKTYEEVYLRGNRTLLSLVKDLEFKSLRSKLDNLYTVYGTESITLAGYGHLIFTYIEAIAGES